MPILGVEKIEKIPTNNKKYIFHVIQKKANNQLL